MVEYDLIGKQFGHLHVYHQGYRKTLAEAIELREELREKYWENYRKNKHKTD